jgi:hypothetical protein
MKVLLDVKDSKVGFVLELLKNFNFIKFKTRTDEKAELIANLKESVDELHLIRKGKLEGIQAKDLLNEL